MVWFLCLMAYQLSWLLDAKVIVVNEQKWYDLTHILRDEGRHSFSKYIR